MEFLVAVKVVVYVSSSVFFGGEFIGLVHEDHASPAAGGLRRSCAASCLRAAKSASVLGSNSYRERLRLSWLIN